MRDSSALLEPDPLKSRLPAWFTKRIEQVRSRPAKRHEFRLASVKSNAGLDELTGPLTRDQVAHLFRRLSLGVTLDQLRDYEGRQPGMVIDELIDDAISREFWVPDWIDVPRQSNTHEFRVWLIEQVALWHEEMICHNHRSLLTGHLQERLMLFWHNHFVAKRDIYFYPTYEIRYLNILRRHAFGDLREFTREVGLTEAMLDFLDGRRNRKESPNTNFARELLELFTMGVSNRLGEPNYSEHDITELARAFTGYGIVWHWQAKYFAESDWDEGDKTIFGRTGAFDYDGAIDLIFDERPREIAEFVCAKIYKEFVYPEVDWDIVSQLADTLVSSDFQLHAVFRLLFKSEHFFDPAFAGTRIKSPIELIHGLLISIEASEITDSFCFSLEEICEILGQRFSEPTTVAGWTGHQHWISTSSLAERWITLEVLEHWNSEGEFSDSLGSFPSRLVNLSDVEAPFSFPIELARFLFAVPLEALDVPEPGTDFAGDLVSNPLPQYVADAHPNEVALMKVFLDGVPWYEWSGEADLGRIYRFLTFLFRIPEFQLA